METTLHDPATTGFTWTPLAAAAVATLVLHAAVRDTKGQGDGPFVVFGKVTDTDGKPLAGVEVNASCGMGSLIPTGTATSGGDGAYRLAFGPGLHVENGALGVGTQVAIISPRLDGWYEILLARRGNLMMTDSQDPPAPADTEGYAGVVVANRPYELNFTLARAATVEGRFLNEFGEPLAGQTLHLTGDILPPSRGILASATTDEGGRFIFRNVPVWLADPSSPLEWRFTLRPFGVRYELESTAFEASGTNGSIHALTLESSGDQHGVTLSLNRRVEDARK